MSPERGRGTLGGCFERGGLPCLGFSLILQDHITRMETAVGGSLSQQPGATCLQEAGLQANLLVVLGGQGQGPLDPQAPTAPSHGFTPKAGISTQCRPAGWHLSSSPGLNGQDQGWWVAREALPVSSGVRHGQVLTPLAQEAADAPLKGLVGATWGPGQTWVGECCLPRAGRRVRSGRFSIKRGGGLNLNPEPGVGQANASC